MRQHSAVFVINGPALVVEAIIAQEGMGTFVTLLGSFDGDCLRQVDSLQLQVTKVLDRPYDPTDAVVFTGFIEDYYAVSGHVYAHTSTGRIDMKFTR